MNWWALRRKIHSSWLVAIACFGIIIGVFGARYFVFFGFWLVLLVASMIAIVVFLNRYVYLILPLIISGLLIGLWRGSVTQFGLAQFEGLYGKTVQVEGMVSDDVDIGSTNQVTIRLSNLIIDGNKLPGKLWVTSDIADIERGDQLFISGDLKPGFGNFAGVIYRSEVERITKVSNNDLALQLRDWFAHAVKLVIPDPEASLGLGYLLGQRRALPADLILALQTAGLTHVVVASGYNLTILVRLARRLFVKVSKYLSALSAGVMVLSFVAITGASPSMLRASLVAALSLAAWYYGRKFHPLVLLPLVAAVTLLIEPSYAWGDLGWQLSFAAFAGVMILAPLLQRFLFGDKKANFIMQLLLETTSAQIVTLPILLLAFGLLSNVAIIANLLVLPLVPLAMLLTFISGLGGVLVPGLADIFGLPAKWLLGYMIDVADLLSDLQWATSSVAMSVWGLIVCYLIIFATCLYLWRKTGYNLREVNLVE